MQRETHFYVDDSGARDPNRTRAPDSREPDWFGLGGVLIDADRTEDAKHLISEFRQRWPQMQDEPFRSYDIRNRTDRFLWLKSVGATQQSAFLQGLTDLIGALPIHVLACVVDRPGYNKLYLPTYGARRWRLCRTAFTIAVERAAKVAIHRDSRLRVYVERSDKVTEAHFKGYYEDMRTQGPPFNVANSEKYRPLGADVLRKTLFEFRVKTKSSALMQFADLVLWPVCKGGYDRDHRALAALRDAGKLLDVHCNEENGLLGCKYSCFEPAQIQKPAFAGLGGHQQSAGVTS